MTRSIQVREKFSYPPSNSTSVVNKDYQNRFILATSKLNYKQTQYVDVLPVPRTLAKVISKLLFGSANKIKTYAKHWPHYKTFLALRCLQIARLHHKLKYILKLHPLTSTGRLQDIPDRIVPQKWSWILVRLWNVYELRNVYVCVKTFNLWGAWNEFVIGISTKENAAVKTPARSHSRPSQVCCSLFWTSMCMYIEQQVWLQLLKSCSPLKSAFDLRIFVGSHAIWVV